MRARGGYTFGLARRATARRDSLQRNLSVPNIASAKKNMRKSRAAAVRNRAQRSALRTALKKARADAAPDGDVVNAVSLLDRAARKGLIHKNKAARHKRQLARKAAAGAGVTVVGQDTKRRRLHREVAPFSFHPLRTGRRSVPASHRRQLAPAPLAVPLGRVVHLAAVLAA